MEEARGGEGVLGIAPEGGFGEEFFYPGDGGFLERAGGVEEELDGVVLGEGCGGEGGIGAGGDAEAEGDIAGGEDVGIGEDGGALEGIFEFADVAWPVVAFHEGAGVFGEAEARVVAFFGEAVDEEAGEEGDVFGALAEGGEVEADDVEAVEEVFAEAADFDFFF